MRSLILGLVIAAATLLVSGRSADAQVISRNNPYRSFNVSGVNYGSMQWQKQHRGNTGVYKSMTTPRRVFRRWR
jgi:hypothetical protein